MSVAVCRPRPCDWLPAAATETAAAESATARAMAVAGGVSAEVEGLRRAAAWLLGDRAFQLAGVGTGPESAYDPIGRHIDALALAQVC